MYYRIEYEAYSISLIFLSLSWLTSGVIRVGKGEGVHDHDGVSGYVRQFYVAMLHVDYSLYLRMLYTVYFQEKCRSKIQDL